MRNLLFRKAGSLAQTALAGHRTSACEQEVQHVRVHSWARDSQRQPARLAWSDEEVEHLHAGEVSIEDGGELVEEEVEGEDDAVPLDAEDAARGRDLGAG